jgi:hypothetical protein
MMSLRTDAPSKVQTISMRRYESEELSNVGLDSPRGANRRSRRFDLSPWLTDGSDEIDLGAKCFRFWGPWSNPLLGGETVQQVSSSWCVSSDMLLVWRLLIFLYLLGTYIALGIRDALYKYTISAEIYGLQVVAAFFVILASVLPRVCGIGRTVENRHSWSSSNSLDDAGPSACCDSGQLLRLVSAILVQSAGSLVVFWNIIFWVRLQNYTTMAMLDRQLLHAYNLVPVVTEVMFGCIVFRLIYFVPGILFIGIYLFLIDKGVSVRGAEKDWIRPLFTEAPERLKARPGLVWILLLLGYIGVCIMVFALQSLRRSSTTDGCLTKEENASFRNSKIRLP